jgi:hypothetical protein
MQTCPKCGYVRKSTDIAPDWQCPSCGIAYAKFRAAPPGPARVRKPENDITSAIGTDQDDERFERKTRSYWNLLTGGMVVFALLIAYMMWKAGEEPELFILLPLFMVGMTMLLGFVGRLLAKHADPGEYAYAKNLDRALELQQSLEASSVGLNQTSPAVLGFTATERNPGSEIFRCRPLSPMQYQVALSGKWGAYFKTWILCAFAGVLVAAGCVLGSAAILSVLLEIPLRWPREIMVGVLVLFSLPGPLWCLWTILSVRGDNLIVYQEGFGLKCNKQVCEALFREVKQIDFGLDPSNIAGDGMREVRPGQWLSTALNLAQNMNVHFASGHTIVVKGFLLRFFPEDIEKSFDYIEKKHPALLKERPRLMRSSEGYFFRIAKTGA